MHRKVPEEDPRARRIKVLLSLGGSGFQPSGGPRGRKITKIRVFSWFFQGWKFSKFRVGGRVPKRVFPEVQLPGALFGRSPEVSGPEGSKNGQKMTIFDDF